MASDQLPVKTELEDRQLSRALLQILVIGFCCGLLTGMAIGWIWPLTTGH